MSDDAFAQIDQDQIAAQVAEKASAQVVEQAKLKLIEDIQGKKPRFSWEEKGKTKPDDYTELFDEVDKRLPKLTPEDIDARVEQKLQEKEEARLKAEEEARTKDAETIQEKAKQFDREWYELVQAGKLPAVSEELQTKINAGERLTKAEIENDEGLKTRLELAQLSTTSGKSAKLAYYEDYQAKPAGAFAPVLGSRPSSPTPETKELDYADVAADRRKVFGY